MDTKQKITIWDTEPSRIARISVNLTLAMNKIGMKFDIDSMSEPPLLSRMGLHGKTPVLEINGLYWTWKIGEDIPQEALEELLFHLKSLNTGK